MKEKIYKYLRYLLIIILFIFLFFGMMTGFEIILEKIFPPDTFGSYNSDGGYVSLAFGLSLFLTLILISLIIQGYLYFKFKHIKYHEILLNFEKYFRVLDKIEKYKNSDEFSEDSEDFFERQKALDDIENLLEDLIIYYSNSDVQSFRPNLSFEVEELLKRVKRKNKNYLRFIRKI